MRFVILHYHIFKNAGSTIEDILDHSFGGRFGTLETPEGGGIVSNREIVRFLEGQPEICAFSSHQIRYPIPQVPGYLFFDICFLRDPLDRIRSAYDYFRQRPNPADPLSALANQCELGDFVAEAIERHPLFVRDNQVNLIACGGDSDEPNEEDLQVAVRRMEEISFLGVVDSFEQSAAAGTEALRCAFPELDCARPAVNVSGGLQGTLASRGDALRKACRPEVFEELLRITALDRRLVEVARAEVLRRFRETHAGKRIGPDAEHVPAGNERVPAGDEKAWIERGTTPSAATLVRRFINLAPFGPELTGRALKALFDRGYYGGSLADYLLRGGYEGRSPSPLFDSDYYLRKYPDVAAKGMNPLCHYLKYGTREMRQPHPLFDPAFYLRKYPDVKRAGLNPLVHYILHGAAEDRKPHPLFDPVYYRAACRESPANPLVDFVSRGAAAANPHWLFDCEAYVEADPEVAARDLNPLVHYLETGTAKQERQPIRLEIEDVLLKAAVRRDAEGVVHWVAEPQQLPFLRRLRPEQLTAQMARPVQEISSR